MVQELRQRKISEWLYQWYQVWFVEATVWGAPRLGTRAHSLHHLQTASWWHTQETPLGFPSLFGQHTLIPHLWCRWHWNSKQQVKLKPALSKCKCGWQIISCASMTVRLKQCSLGPKPSKNTLTPFPLNLVTIAWNHPPKCHYGQHHEYADSYQQHLQICLVCSLENRHDKTILKSRHLLKTHVCICILKTRCHELPYLWNTQHSSK